jgi:hypothetical protein
MTDFSHLVFKKDHELSETERLKYKKVAEEVTARQVEWRNRLLNRVGVLKNRSADEQIPPEIIALYNKKDELLERYESRPDRVVDPETKELIDNLKSLVEVQHAELNKISDLHSNRTTYDQSCQKVRNGAGGKATKQKYAHITSVAINVVKRYMQEHPDKLGMGIYKRGVKTEVNDLIRFEMSKEENYKKVDANCCPDDSTIRIHREKAFKALGLTK